jgi:hypothetical protein
MSGAASAIGHRPTLPGESARARTANRADKFAVGKSIIQLIPTVA